MMKMSGEKPKRGRPATGQAKTPAQIQKAYRERVKRLAASYVKDREQGSTRLSAWLPAGAVAGIGRLARMAGCTKVALLTRLIMDAENALTAGMTDEQIDAYYSVTQ